MAPGLVLAVALVTPALAREAQFATVVAPGRPRDFAAYNLRAARVLTPPAVPASIGQQVADLVKGEVGAPYVYGGSDPSGFDCSGLVLWAYARFGVSLEHDESAALAVGSPVAQDALQPGDVLVFQDTYQAGPSHAGIYVGDGRFVHAEDEQHGVLVSRLDSEFWSSHFYAAARLAPPPSATD